MSTTRQQHRLPAEPYNIIPLHDPLADHPTLHYPEVRAALAALRTTDGLRSPPGILWAAHYDLLDWLGYFFGFQADNIKNQREHLVLQLANAQMRSTPLNNNSLEPAILHNYRTKLLQNYSLWCGYLERRSSIQVSDTYSSNNDMQLELLYVALYLLIWGESANLRFAPECLCYIFHHMALDLNKIMGNCTDADTGRPFLPNGIGELTFLNNVVKPIYDTISKEVKNSKDKNGSDRPHSKWRNYDDINEYFWSNRCFEKLGWPIDVGSTFFIMEGSKRHISKTGYVEQRSFWNLWRSFDRLWVMLFLFLQVAIILAWEQEANKKGNPWQSLRFREVQVKCLTVFLTWSVMRFLQAVLDLVMQYKLTSVETISVGIRMALKFLAAGVWAITFGVIYGKIWTQRDRDGGWSPAADKQVISFLLAVAVFVLPEVLALVLFTIPWVRNFIEETNWKIFYYLTWWFQKRIFVGRGLREGLADNIRYTLFWILVLATKLVFSYFLQIKPMIIPTKILINLKGVRYEWPEISGGSNRFAVGLLWLPVILIYLMDVQIWYSIYSSFVGISVGLLSHLGEIRNIEQFRLRFQFFASAMQFNLMPEEQLLNSNGIRSKFRDYIHRLKLRYGLGQPYKKLESNEINQVEAFKFAWVWNEVISLFREEDIINDQEVELLELPQNAWNISVIRWPCILLSNELLQAVSLAEGLENASDKRLWHKICKAEYRRCAVIEAYDSIKYLLLAIVKHGTEEHSIVTELFGEIDHAIKIEKITKIYDLDVLKKIHEKLDTLLKLLIAPKKRILDKVVSAVQALYETIKRDFYIEKRTTQQMMEDGLAPRSGKSLLFQNAVQLPNNDAEDFYRQVRRLHTILSSKDAMHHVPRNLEARRRIAFFSNSLFMNIPHAPQVEKMLAFSVLTPFYEEDVIFSTKQLTETKGDGGDIIHYLQTVYKDEWENFQERMGCGKETDTDHFWKNKPQELRLWASYRGQTLSRTVRGMMYYHRALKMLAFLDSATEIDIRKGTQQPADARQTRGVDRLGTEREASSRNGSSPSQASSSMNQLFKGHEHIAASMKYTYVIACQLYGSQKAKKQPQAEEILQLLKSNEALRVAYVDEVSVGRDAKEYYSVLIKYDQQLEQEVEIYRVRLPGPIKLGEGKPENQNHALIFTRGDAIQTIDMNQDNYFEEALKMRNLLEEFNHKHGIRKPTILGVREHIFTSSVSSIARFMSAQEMSFVTLGQRVLANPLKIRMHYGHPDVFDRFWFLTRGGISKASKLINISEDIFAGFNCTLRGGNVTHHEYIQVGKGRDVGVNQISMFEAKVASGNGEQVLSRDVYRLGHRLDFFRMLSFFYTTVGFYFNTMMVVLTVYAFLWGRLYLALSGIEASVEANASTSNAALSTILNQQLIVQLGLFTALPMIVENSLELGFLNAIWDFITMQLQLSSIFFTFSMGTRSHHFGRTILHGGASYRATGRGFVVQHTSFVENYRLFSRSHFVKAIELGLILITYAAFSPVAKGTFVYIALTISSWFLVISWIIAPFVFNPLGFDWLKTVEDSKYFTNWIWHHGGVFGKPEDSWEVWWEKEQVHLKTTGLWGNILEVILDLRYFFFQYGIVYHLGIAAGDTRFLIYVLSWIYMLVAIGIFAGVSYARDKYSARGHIYYRLVQLLVILSVVILIACLLKFTKLKLIDLLTSLLGFIPTGWGLISIAVVFRKLLEPTFIWNGVKATARLYDIMLGAVILSIVGVLSWVPGFQAMQTRILFNEAFNRNMRINQILTNKKTKLSKD